MDDQLLNKPPMRPEEFVQACGEVDAAQLLRWTDERGDVDACCAGHPGLLIAATHTDRYDERDGASPGRWRMLALERDVRWTF
eukprot:COSAG02_NODE_4073_length_5830_cov_3.915373_1_plen_83_part_00